MPHAAEFDVDFRKYAATRNAALKHVALLRGHLAQIETILKAYPKTNEEAGYLDLDNAQQIECDLKEAVDTLCTGYGFEFVEWERSRLGVK